jgi:hypothetical protein
MSNSIYTPITTPFANTEFTSIRVDNVDYYIVSQLLMDEKGISGFPIHQKTAQRDFKRILGKENPVTKFATSLHSGKVVCISHDQLDEIVAYFARKKGSDFCWDLMRASFNTELRRANDYKRGCLEKEEFYQTWAAERIAGIKRRRSYTDFIKMCEDSGINVSYAHLTIEVYRYTNLLDKYYAWKREHETQSQRNKNPFRGTLNQIELYEVGCLEDRLARAGTKHKLSPQDAIKWVVDDMY